MFYIICDYFARLILKLFFTQKYFSVKSEQMFLGITYENKVTIKPKLVTLPWRVPG